MRLRVQSVAWRGEDEPGSFGAPHDFSAVPPKEYRDRYLITGSLRFRREPFTINILSVQVTDRETGATVTLPDDGRSEARLNVAADAATEYVAGLWTDARQVAGLVQRGRPPKKAEDVRATLAEAVRGLRQQKKRPPYDDDDLAVYALVEPKTIGRCGDRFPALFDELTR